MSLAGVQPFAALPSSTTAAAFASSVSMEMHSHVQSSQQQLVQQQQLPHGRGRFPSDDPEDREELRFAFSSQLASMVDAAAVAVATVASVSPLPSRSGSNRNTIAALTRYGSDPPAVPGANRAPRVSLSTLVALAAAHPSDFPVQALLQEDSSTISISSSSDHDDDLPSPSAGTGIMAASASGPGTAAGAGGGPSSRARLPHSQAHGALGSGGTAARIAEEAAFIRGTLTALKQATLAGFEEAGEAEVLPGLPRVWFNQSSARALAQGGGGGSGVHAAAGPATAAAAGGQGHGHTGSAVGQPAPAWLALDPSVHEANLAALFGGGGGGSVLQSPPAYGRGGAALSPSAYAAAGGSSEAASAYGYVSHSGRGSSSVFRASFFHQALAHSGSVEINSGPTSQQANAIPAAPGRPYHPVHPPLLQNPTRTGSGMASVPDDCFSFSGASSAAAAALAAAAIGPSSDSLRVADAAGSGGGGASSEAPAAAGLGGGRGGGDDLVSGRQGQLPRMDSPRQVPPGAGLMPPAVPQYADVLQQIFARATATATAAAQQLRQRQQLLFQPRPQLPLPQPQQRPPPEQQHSAQQPASARLPHKRMRHDSPTYHRRAEAGQRATLGISTGGHPGGSSEGQVQPPGCMLPGGRHGQEGAEQADEDAREGAQRKRRSLGGEALPRKGPSAVAYGQQPHGTGASPAAAPSQALRSEVTSPGRSAPGASSHDGAGRSHAESRPAELHSLPGLPAMPNVTPPDDGRMSARGDDDSRGDESAWQGGTTAADSASVRLDDRALPARELEVAPTPGGPSGFEAPTPGGPSGFEAPTSGGEPHTADSAGARSRAAPGPGPRDAAAGVERNGRGAHADASSPVAVTGPAAWNGAPAPLAVRGAAAAAAGSADRSSGGSGGSADRRFDVTLSLPPSIGDSHRAQGQTQSASQLNYGEGEPSVLVLLAPPPPTAAAPAPLAAPRRQPEPPAAAALDPAPCAPLPAAATAAEAEVTAFAQQLGADQRQALAQLVRDKWSPFSFPLLSAPPFAAVPEPAAFPPLPATAFVAAPALAASDPLGPGAPGRGADGAEAAAAAAVAGPGQAAAVPAGAAGAPAAAAAGTRALGAVAAGGAAPPPGARYAPAWPPYASLYVPLPRVTHRPRFAPRSDIHSADGMGEPSSSGHSAGGNGGIANSGGGGGNSGGGNSRSGNSGGGNSAGDQGGSSSGSARWPSQVALSAGAVASTTGGGSWLSSVTPSSTISWQATAGLPAAAAGGRGSDSGRVHGSERGSGGAAAGGAAAPAVRGGYSGGDAGLAPHGADPSLVLPKLPIAAAGMPDAATSPSAVAAAAAAAASVMLVPDPAGPVSPGGPVASAAHAPRPAGVAAAVAAQLPDPQPDPVMDPGPVPEPVPELSGAHLEAVRELVQRKWSPFSDLALGFGFPPLVPQQAPPPPPPPLQPLQPLAGAQLPPARQAAQLLGSPFGPAATEWREWQAVQREGPRLPHLHTGAPGALAAAAALGSAAAERGLAASAQEPGAPSLTDSPTLALGMVGLRSVPMIPEEPSPVGSFSEDAMDADCPGRNMEPVIRNTGPGAKSLVVAGVAGSQSQVAAGAERSGL